MSAVKCVLCPAGYLLPKVPTVIGDSRSCLSPVTTVTLVPGSPWLCGGCGKVVGVSSVQERLRAVLETIARRRDEDNTALVEVISSLGSSLHPNHYLILGIKEIIIQRLMLSIAKSKHQNTVGRIYLLNIIEIIIICHFMISEESVIAEYKLRTEMFSHVASVLQLVDSKGTGWLQRLELIKKEEDEFICRGNKIMD